MRYVALKALPYGQQPGDHFEADEAVGHVLILVGAARLEEDALDAPPETPKSDSPRRYRRRDLKAQS